MIIKNRRSFIKGMLMAAVFVVVLVVMFMPVFKSGNAFRAADKLFNTISKGSTYYIPMLRENAKAHVKETFNGTIKVAKEHTEDVRKVLSTAGAQVSRAGDGLMLEASMGTLYEAVLRDSDDMFANRGKALSDRYGIPEKRVLFAWWSCFRAIAKAMDAAKRFSESKYIAELTSRGIEVGYNYYGVTPEKAADRWLILTSALIFYVIYTLWWGFAVYFLFEGFGLQLTAGHKKDS